MVMNERLGSGVAAGAGSTGSCEDGLGGVGVAEGSAGAVLRGTAAFGDSSGSLRAHAATTTSRMAVSRAGAKEMSPP